ncbi:hypothetical protein DSO57_1026017 [Entomophthora muscae]|uniref:Uncharacterized protein n=1 Tax=Entomophthora muscae TaxID=34485 RepID=A0ACC2RT44_9FUNG|nr:hypothetical protein DSO57_1026017 [Entomophthora muscae]
MLLTEQLDEINALLELDMGRLELKVKELFAPLPGEVACQSRELPSEIFPSAKQPSNAAHDVIKVTIIDVHETAGAQDLKELLCQITADGLNELDRPADWVGRVLKLLVEMCVHLDQCVC